MPDRDHCNVHSLTVLVPRLQQRLHLAVDAVPPSFPKNHAHRHMILRTQATQVRVSTADLLHHVCRPPYRDYHIHAIKTRGQDIRSTSTNPITFHFDHSPRSIALDTDDKASVLPAQPCSKCIRAGKWRKGYGKACGTCMAGFCHVTLRLQRLEDGHGHCWTANSGFVSVRKKRRKCYRGLRVPAQRHSPQDGTDRSCLQPGQPLTLEVEAPFGRLPSLFDS